MTYYETQTSGVAKIGQIPGTAGDVDIPEPYKPTFWTDAISASIACFTKSVTAVHTIWTEPEFDHRPKVFFANHTSMGDFVLLWAVMPKAFRRMVRPVAGSDYWLKSRSRTYICHNIFNAVLIDRNRDTRTEDPVERMIEVLDGGSSLILFPEGTRNVTGQRLLPFKSGLFHLANARPSVDLVPVWIKNLNRVLPKGQVIPVPHNCTVTFGAAFRLQEREQKKCFLARAEQRLQALSQAEGVLQ